MKLRKSTFDHNTGERIISISDSWISNGHWMIKRDTLTGILKDGDTARIRSYLCRKESFDYLETYSDSYFENVIPKDISRRIGIIDEVTGDYPTLILFKGSHSHDVWFDKRYVEAFDLKALVGYKELTPWQTLDGNVIVMPCRHQVIK